MIQASVSCFSGTWHSLGRPAFSQTQGWFERIAREHDGDPSPQTSCLLQYQDWPLGGSVVAMEHRDFKITQRRNSGSKFNGFSDPVSDSSPCHFSCDWQTFTAANCSCVCFEFAFVPFSCHNRGACDSAYHDVDHTPAFTIVRKIRVSSIFHKFFSLRKFRKKNVTEEPAVSTIHVPASTPPYFTALVICLSFILLVGVQAWTAMGEALRAVEAPDLLTERNEGQPLVSDIVFFGVLIYFSKGWSWTVSIC